MVTNELNQPVSAEYDQNTGRYYPVGSAVGQRPDGSKIYPSEKAITRYEKKDEAIDFGQAVSQ
jgi:hypothetical protein